MRTTKCLLLFSMILLADAEADARPGKGKGPPAKARASTAVNAPPRLVAPAPTVQPLVRPAAAPAPTVQPLVRPAAVPVSVVVSTSTSRRQYYVASEGRWVGHDSGRDDVRYHVASPWSRGRFVGVGRDHIYRLNGWSPVRHRFWFGVHGFLVAQSDWVYVDGWSFTNDDVVIHEDHDHEGWYLAHNTRLGTFVHVSYDGGKDD